MRTYTVIVVNPLEQCDKDDKPAGMLFQYDYGQRIVFGGVDLPQAYEVHFSNQKMGKSVTVIGDVTGVDIPDAMLLTGQDVHVWLYLHQGESDGETVYYARIAVRQRAKPTHETPTPVQQDEITQAIAALNAAVESTEADAAAAEASAEDAGRSQAAAEAAQDRAEAAQGAAESAQTWAETAQDKAEDAQEAAEGARDRAEAAAAFLEDCNAEAETLTAGSAATASYSEGVFHFGIPRGSKGSKGDPGDRGPEGPTGPEGPEGPAGYSPTASVSKSGSTATISITDKTGTTTATVSDGEDGAPGQDGYTPVRGTDYWTAADQAAVVADVEADLIDDTAGAGDTTNVWSADKSSSVASGLLSAIDSKAPVILCDASGDIVTFADGADGMPLSSCVVSVDPVQDLHGQANPYPAGGGKNLLPLMVDKIKSTNTAGTWNGNAYTLNGLTFTINTDASGNVSGINVNGTASANTVFDFFPSNSPLNYTGTYILNGCPSGGSTSTYRLYAICNVSGSSSYPSDTGSGSSAFTLAADDYISYTRIEIKSGTAVSNIVYKPMIRVSTADGTFAPYSNICPITGHTGCNVTRAGKNLYNPNTDTLSAYLNGTGQIVTLSGGQWSISDYIPVIAGKKYTASGLSNGGSGAYICTYDADKNFIGSIAITANESNTFTVQTGRKYVRLSVRRSDNEYETAQFEQSETATAFSPQATTYPISWQTAAGTVYGGTVDTKTGVLTVDRAIVDMGTRTWSINGDRFVDGAKIVPNPVSQATWGVSNPIAICSSYKYGNIGSGSGVDDAFGFYNGYLYARDTAYETAADFKAAVNGVMVVYKLATPVTYQLDPVQIATLLGENHIWADTGAIAVTYPADTQTYVDNAIQTATDPDGNVVTVSGSTPSITGESGKRYVCGTVDSISITPPSTGIVDVVFTSGTTPAVLTASGVTWPGWFDSTSLSASTVYELNISNGLGVVQAWQT